MYRRSVNIAILLVILLLTAQFLAGSAQSAGGYRNASVDHAAGPSANPLPGSVDSIPAGPPQAWVEAALRSSPVMFIENVGQFADDARFRVWGGPGTMWLAEDGLWITLVERLHVERSTFPHPDVERDNVQRVNVKLTFPGANPHPRIEPFDRLDTVVSYFIGNDPDQWHPDVPVWAGVRYVDLYPGVDLEFTSEGGRWTWRLLFRDPQYPISNIQLRVAGADALASDNEHLRLTTAVGNFTLPLLRAVAHDSTPLELPVGRPEINGTEITSPFALMDPTAVAPQDNLDDLLYSTFLGGGDDDRGSAIAVDGAGRAYVAGYTESDDFPASPGAFAPRHNGGGDAFVVKLNAEGTELAYATFLGGSSGDGALAITIDGASNAYVTGETWSSDFPTTVGAFDTSHNGYYDTFVTKLDATGSALIYSTFLGGTGSRGSGIAVNGSGEVYVSGRARAGFPTTSGAFDTTHNGGGNDAFVAKLNAAGSALVYATYLGGSGDDCWGIGCVIAVDGNGMAYVAGNTPSTDFPTTPEAFDTTHNGSHDIFVAKLNAVGSALVYATYIGGSGDDCYEKCAVAVDGMGNAYVTGRTSSSDFPTTEGAFDISFNGGGTDAFAVKVNTNGSGLAYATFLGGNDYDYGLSIAVDRAGSAHVAGATLSSDFPTTTRGYDLSHNGSWDAFVVKFNTNGTELAYATFLGGNGNDEGHAIAVDEVGDVYVAGATGSPSFPTTAGAFDTSHNGGWDAFVAKLAMEKAAGPLPDRFLFTIGAQAPVGQFNAPTDLAMAPDGTVYVVDQDNHRIQHFSAAGDFLNTWGTLGSGNGQFWIPRGVAVAPDGTVYVADMGNHRVQRFSPTGQFLGEWGGFGSSDGQLSNPSGVTVAPDSTVYVTDTGNHRVQRFSPDGQFLGKWGGFGSNDGQFHNPHGIVVAPDGTIYVADSSNHRIQHFGPTGTLLDKWGSEGSNNGQFRHPAGLAIGDGRVYVADTWNYRVQIFTTTGDYLSQWAFSYWLTGVAADERGRVYVADSGSHRIVVRGADGSHVAEWGRRGTSNSQFWIPSDVATSSEGITYVADSWNHRIQRIDSDGVFLDKWGIEGSDAGQLNSPRGIAVAPDGTVYVADTGNHRIQRFSPTGKFLSKWGSLGSGDGQFDSPHGVAVAPDGTIYVADRENHRIQRFTATGAFLEKWGTEGTGDGQFDKPADLAVAPDATVYVVDEKNHRIQRFTTDGGFLGKWGTWGRGDGQFDGPLGIAVAPDGTVYVADRSNHRVQHFSATGIFLGKLGGFGSDYGQFNLPRSVSVASDGTLYVIDTESNRIQAFGTAYLNSWHGEYFANRWLVEAPAFIRNEIEIDFDWGSGSPGSGVPADNFSARWQRYVWLETDTYHFIVSTDGGVRLWVDDRLLIEQWQEQDAAYSADIFLAQGYHRVRLEYYDGSGLAAIHLSWTAATPPSGPDIQVTPATVEVTLPEGQSTTVPLSIRNAGDAALTFSIDQRPATAAGESQSTDLTNGRRPSSKVDPALWDALDESPDGRITFFVYLKEQAGLSHAYAIQDWKAKGEFVYRTLRETAQRSQKELLADLETRKAAGIITDYRPFFIINAVAVTGGRSAVETLAARPDVARLAPEPAFRIPEPIDEKETSAAPNGVEWNIAQIGADRVWRELGVTGAGVVVANIDTGVDHTHPALVRQYRGTTTGSHDYNWFDPTGKYPDAPGDNHGHGTHVMGIMVGDDRAGNQIGVAPGAQWIAAKGCAGNGCTGSDLLAAAEWILAPCPIGVQPGNPACDPAKRPQVVNNSWGGAGGDIWFEETVQAWRAAGIFPAFAAGNSGPGDGTVGSPGDYAGSFASGASDDADAICWFSSRGPSRLTPEIKPDVTAPGCNIRSALPGGSYGTKSGTSMASPHIAGVVALLRQANLRLSLSQIEALLNSTTLDLGPPGPDHTYGYGRLDAYSAVSKALDDPITSWLTVSPTSGTVPPGDQRQIALTLNATGLSNSTHTANLTITNNDSDEPTVNVPVTLTVTPGAPKIAHVRVSNLRDVSAAVSWITTLPATGRVYYGTNPASLTSVAHDDRGAGTEDDVHHVTIGGLNPNTTYYFYVVSDDAYDDSDGRYYQFTTGAPLSVPGSDSVYGQVFKSDGVTPAADVLVYLRVLDNDGQGSPGQSELLSGLTDSNGYWIDSKTGGAVNLAAARSEGGQSYFVYSPSGDSVRIEIEGAADCEGLTQVDTANDSPAPDITLSCLNMIELDITTGWSTFVWPAAPAEDYAASDLLGAIAEANGDAPEISQWVPELGNWSGHLRGLPFNNFEVAPGEPYFMRANRRSLLQLPAGIGIAQRDVITLTTGWNFVALPRTAGVIEAESACQQIAGQGGAVEDVVRWDANVGNWAAHVCGLPFGDFQMTPDQGYFIKSQTNSTWHPEGSSGTTTVAGRNPEYAIRSTQYATREDVAIHNIQTTNAADRSFTVLWETDQPASGRVRFGSNPATLDGVAHDDRGADVADHTHHVTVAGLSPGTTYYFAVVSGGTTDDNGGALYQVATGPTLGIPSVQSVYGRVLRVDGETPAAGVLVQVVLRDGDGEGSAGQSAPLSAVTDAQGWWSVNLGAARTVAGDAYFATDGDDHLAITAWHPALGGTSTEVALRDLPALLPLEMTVVGERVYLPLVMR